jgi:hypothetical protein
MTFDDMIKRAGLTPSQARHYLRPAKLGEVPEEFEKFMLKKVDNERGEWAAARRILKARRDNPS